MRRFPYIPQHKLGFEGAPIIFTCLGVVALVGAAFAARYLGEDKKLEATKKHHPKGIGFTSMNHQKELLRKATKKIAPNLDENFYEYSRHNPLRHR